MRLMPAWQGRKGRGQRRELGGQYLAEFVALVAHLLAHAAGLGTQVVAQVDGMDGGAGLLVQRGLLPDPVVDLPAQRAIIVQEGLGGDGGRVSAPRSLGCRGSSGGDGGWGLGAWRGHPSLPCPGGGTLDSIAS